MAHESEFVDRCRTVCVILHQIAAFSTVITTLSSANGEFLLSLTPTLAFHSAAFSWSAHINTCQDGDRVAEVGRPFHHGLFVYICSRPCASAAASAVSLGFMLTSVLHVVSQSSVTACCEEDNTLKGQADR